MGTSACSHLTLESKAGIATGRPFQKLAPSISCTPHTLVCLSYLMSPCFTNTYYDQMSGAHGVCDSLSQMFTTTSPFKSYNMLNAGGYSL